MGSKLSRVTRRGLIHRTTASDATAQQTTVASTTSLMDDRSLDTGVSSAVGIVTSQRLKRTNRRSTSRRSDNEDQPGKFPTTSDQPATPTHMASTAGTSSLWNKLIRHLSRKTTAVRRRRRRRAGSGGAENQEDGRLMRPGGTASVLPVNRNPVTTVFAYTDDDRQRVGENGTQRREKDLTDVNSNLADILPRIQASTGELLAGFAEFVRCRCIRLRHFDGSEVTAWLRSVDRLLIDHAWQDTPFIGPANLVLVYLLACDAVDPDIITVGELQAILMACLYVAFSYAGSEISYPLKPFISAAGVDEVTPHTTSASPAKKRFWNRCLAIIERSSGEMLRLNREPAYFAALFRELKTYAASSPQYSNMTSSSCRSRDLPSNSVRSSNGLAAAAQRRYHGNEE